MDEDLESFAEELKRLRPASPPAGLERQLEQELGPERPGTSPGAWVWIAVPLAAAIAVTTFVARRPSTAGPNRIAPKSNLTAAVSSPNVFKPVASENVLYAATDEGMVTLDNGAPARRERLKFVDTITWENPATHASLTWNIPREEVRVTPVRYQ